MRSGEPRRPAVAIRPSGRRPALDRRPPNAPSVLRRVHRRSAAAATCSGSSQTTTGRSGREITDARRGWTIAATSSQPGEKSPRAGQIAARNAGLSRTSSASSTRSWRDFWYSVSGRSVQLSTFITERCDSTSKLSASSKRTFWEFRWSARRQRNPRLWVQPTWQASPRDFGRMSWNLRRILGWAAASNPAWTSPAARNCTRDGNALWSAPRGGRGEPRGKGGTHGGIAASRYCGPECGDNEPKKGIAVLRPGGFFPSASATTSDCASLLVDKE